MKTRTQQQAHAVGANASMALVRFLAWAIKFLMPIYDLFAIPYFFFLGITSPFSEPDTIGIIPSEILAAMLTLFFYTAVFALLQPIAFAIIAQAVLFPCRGFSMWCT